MESEALLWLQSPDAGVAARRELQRLRLPASLDDDVLQAARIRAWRMAEAHDQPPENAVAVAYRAIQRSVADLYRRTRRRVTEVDLDDTLGGLEDVAGAGPGEIEMPGDLEDSCRRAAHGRLAAKPWVGAAVLNELTFRLHPDVPFPAGAPAPTEGTDDHRVSWAALWLAGRTECFTGHGCADDAARRQRRARALSATAAELRQVVEMATARRSR